jgi:hypothetical protein
MPAAVLHIRHVPGVDNVVANTLSRPPSHRAGPDSCSHTAGPDSCSHTAGAVSAVSPSAELLDYASIAKIQLVCPLTKRAASSSSLRLVHVNVHGQQLLCNVSRGGQRPLILEVDRMRVFRAFHELSHPGRNATHGLMSARVIWRGIGSDIAAWYQPTDVCGSGCQATHGLDGGHPCVLQRWRGHYTSGSTLRWPIQGGGRAGQIFQAGDRWPAGDGVSEQVKASPGTGSCGVGRPPVHGRPLDWVTDFDAPAWNRFSWHTCQVFFTPGIKVWQGAMWRPIFIIVLYVIVLWGKFNYVKIPQSEAKKICELLG